MYVCISYVCTVHADMVIRIDYANDRPNAAAPNMVKPINGVGTSAAAHCRRIKA